jgi:aryl-alcohol dehydrogenase-like predicted oxidoreductase
MPELQKRSFGADGPLMSTIGLGCYNFGLKLDGPASRAVVAAALDAGITHFDTAESYGDGVSEEWLGEALGSLRDEVVIATKFKQRPVDEPYTPGAARKRVREGCEGSLRRLGTDRIDVFYEHRPDHDAPREEVLEAMYELMDEGKVAHVACSNYTREQIEHATAWALAHDHPRLAGNQFHWNLLARDTAAEVMPTMVREGMGAVPYFPLASGLLTGKYQAGQKFPEGSRLAVIPALAWVATNDSFEVVERLEAFARDNGRTLVELALGWLISQPGATSVIVGSSTPEQVRANLAASTWHLTEDELAAVAVLLEPTGEGPDSVASGVAAAD